MCSYQFYKDVWEVEISSEELPFYLSQTIAKIIMQLWSFDCLKAASTASLSSSVVADSRVLQLIGLQAFIHGHMSLNTYEEPLKH